MHKHKQHQCKSRSNWKNKMFREGVSDRDITYAFSFELEMGWGHGTDFSCKIPQEIN